MDDIMHPDDYDWALGVCAAYVLAAIYLDGPRESTRYGDRLLGDDYDDAGLVQEDGGDAGEAERRADG